MTEFAQPQSLKEAADLLARRPGLILAGGTDLMIELRHNRLQALPRPELVVDVSRIAELNRLDVEGPEPFIGAAVSYARLESDPAVAARYPLLARAASMVGSAQIRRTGTLGGNAATGSPAGDGVCALTALGAEVKIVSAEGGRRLAISELITAPNRTILKPGEIIEGFFLDALNPDAAQTFTKVGRRQAVAVARLNLALALNKDLTEVRICLGSCFPSPRRMNALEEMIAVGTPGQALWNRAGQAAAGEFVNVCGLRSSAAYKLPAIRRVMAAGLKKTWQLAQAGGER